MTRGLSMLLVTLLLLTGLTGCLGGSGPETNAGGAPVDDLFPACVHPWPCADGSEWPRDLEGPFDLREVIEARVPVIDGIELHGYILLPDVPDGVKVPVVLAATIYYGHVYQTPESLHYDVLRVGGEVHGPDLVAEGYAVAYFNSRGSGQSDGCMEWWGPNEQRDLAMLADWLGDQAWSNGRVAMTGVSYGGTTPYAAAIHNPSALKTIVPIATVTDPYLFLHSPQGAPFVGGGEYLNAFTAAMGISPPFQGEPTGTIEHATRLQDRLCPDTLAIIEAFETEQWSDTRDQAFWDERRLIDGFPGLSAAVLIAHGFEDGRYSGHGQQELSIWHALENAPKRMLEGQWGHSSPPMSSWQGELFAWYDFWLKGIGDAPAGLGEVSYQDDTGAWHETTAWPPADAHEEVLYLTGATLAPQTGSGDRSFLAAPHPAGAAGVLCEALTREALVGDADGLAPTLGLAYLSEPVEAETLVAGNPFAYLQLSSDRSRGLFTLDLYDVAPEATCADGAPEGTGIRPLSIGSVDLGFHDGNFDVIPFPIDAPTHVRVDLENLAHVLPAGHRLALVLSYGEADYRHASSPSATTLTVLTDGGPLASHIVVPVVTGTLGGEEATVEYPARPFLP